MIYCDNLDSLVEDGKLVKKLAREIQKRVTLRPDSSIRLSPEEAKEKLRN